MRAVLLAVGVTSSGRPSIRHEPSTGDIMGRLSSPQVLEGWTRLPRNTVVDLFAPGLLRTVGRSDPHSDRVRRLLGVVVRGQADVVIPRAAVSRVGVEPNGG